MLDPAEEYASIAAEIARHALAQRIAVGSAESLTCGAISIALGAAPDASQWFHGSIVAYDEIVKRDLLGVAAKDLVSLQCARQMARGASRLLWAHAAVAVTGVGGPDPVDGHPPGSVFIATAFRGITLDDHWCFEGTPAEVVHSTVGVALRMLERVIRETS